MSSPRTKKVGNWPHCKKCGRPLAMLSTGLYICSDCGWEFDPGEAFIVMDLQEQKINDLERAIDILRQEKITLVNVAWAAREMLEELDNATENDEWSTTELREALASCKQNAVD